MSIGELVLLMMFLHVLDDYVLQGILASLKQKSWWETNAPDPKYKNDYLAALFFHGFSWSFMIHLPLFIIGWKYVIASIIIQGLIHSFIDDQKANKFRLNLIQDQLFHMIQIASIVLLYLIL